MLHCLTQTGTGSKLDITAVANANNQDWDITVTAANTAALKSGNWKWVAYVEKASERYTYDEGVLFVEPNLATATEGTQQSHNEKMLAAIQSVLQGRATNDIESYQIAGRAVNKIPVAELIKLENIYIAKVRRERNPEQFGVRHLVEFNNP